MAYLNTNFIERVRGKIAKVVSDRDFRKHRTFEELVAFSMSSAINANRQAIMAIYKVG